DPQSVELMRRIISALLLRGAGQTPPSPALKSGTRIGGFEVLEQLARGRQLEVYRARSADAAAQTDGAQVVALQRYDGPAVPLWTERFLSAARVGSHLHHHPGVVRVYSAMADISECWLVTELVSGSFLEEALTAAARRGEHLPVGAILTMAQQLLVTLEDYH